MDDKHRLSNPRGVSAERVRQLWSVLIFDNNEEADVLDVLDRWASTGSRFAGYAADVAAAIRASDRELEAAHWRRLEISAPFGFPSDIGMHTWRYDPQTGKPLSRYAGTTPASS